MTLDEREKERARIRDEDLARMDRIAADKGEGHYSFWLAMQFATERLRQFDERHPVHACKP